MKVYFVRHGQTDWNAAHRMQGCVDILLNETGKAQIAEVAGKIEGIEFDKMYVSPLTRTKQTASILRPEMEQTLEERVKEIDFGELEGSCYGGYKTLVYEELNDKEKQIYHFFLDPDKYEPLAGGETYEHFYERLNNFLEDIKVKHKDETVLVVCHGAVIHAVICLIRKITMGECWKIYIGNGDCYMAEFDGEKWTDKLF